jgi:hypothetical protein
VLPQATMGLPVFGRRSHLNRACRSRRWTQIIEFDRPRLKAAKGDRLRAGSNERVLPGVAWETGRLG